MSESEQPENPFEKAHHNEVLELVDQSLYQCYYQGVIPALSVVTSIAEQYPEQTDNQVRNAMTHYGRALYEVDSLEEAQEEISAAESHMKRGTRDAYKIILIIIHDEIRTLYESIIYAQGQLPKPVFDSYTGYISLRSALYSHESSNRLDSFMEKYAAEGLPEGMDPFILVTDAAIELRDQMITLTKGPAIPSQLVLKTARLKHRWGRRVTGGIKWTLLAVVAGLIGFGIKDVFETDWGKAVNYFEVLSAALSTV